MYTLDTQSARKADTTGNTIKELGKYVGSFVQAKDVTTKKGGKGIELVFKNDAGETATPAIYTTGANGDRRLLKDPAALRKAVDDTLSAIDASGATGKPAAPAAPATPATPKPAGAASAARPPLSSFLKK